ncbi:aminotransferase class I/II-fold pyridoxal phosphate-dependent enzyme [Mesorhizobium sp. M1307]|uniref:aminotransferase class I/II-fold pyridoxal phosphate-dependent enzyme n=1 Tax=Mesorhizobium sp. M1307 TaxID=2957079 RepID=UPI0033358F6B
MGGALPNFAAWRVGWKLSPARSARRSAMPPDTSGNTEVIDWVRQRSRPYLFSNTLAPVMPAASLKVFDVIEHGSVLRQKLYANAERFRSKMRSAGFSLAGADHPKHSSDVGGAFLAQQITEKMLSRGIYHAGFYFPVVPKGQARTRTQMSAANSLADIDCAVETFVKVGKELGVIP